MEITICQIDAFAEKLFEGNPAAVCLLDHWFDDAILQKIAMENNLSETAFLVKAGDGWELRWFTPEAEVDLCGHATLASAHALFSRGDVAGGVARFFTKKHGILSVERLGDEYRMDFPADVIEAAALPEGLAEALGIEPLEVWQGRDDYMLLARSQEEVEGLRPDFRRMKEIRARGVLVTAPGRDVDFVSRCFFPQVGVDEDPVTGSAHTTMAPYWAHKLGKNTLLARQLSKRGGAVGCEVRGERVLLRGKAAVFFEGVINLK
jgi:PhzF family phenazine biosynthesis protein